MKWLLLAFLSLPAVADEIIAPSIKEHALLGTGFATKKDQFEEGCVVGETKYSGAPTSTIGLTQILSQSELSDSLGFSAGTKFRYGLVSVSAAAKFMSSSQSTSYSLSTVYEATYHFKNEILTKPEMSEIGKKVMENDERWLETCGDHYVWQRELGAKIYFSIRIDFSSEADKKYFEANFSLAAPMLSIASSLEKAKERLSKKTTVNVSAIQVGGSVEKLSQIFGNSDDRMAFVDCSIGKFENCHKVLKSALDYATDTQNGFPAQIVPELGTENPSGPAILAYYTKSYKGAGIYPATYPLLEPAIASAREELANRFEQNYGFRTKVQQLLFNKSMRLSQRQRESLSDAQTIVDANIKKILATSKICYERPIHCPESVRALQDPETGAVLIGEELEGRLRIRPESFAQYCDLSQQPFPDPEIKATVDVLVAEAKTIDKVAFLVEEEQELDVCALSEDILNRVRHLNLKGKSISDLQPLAAFTQLEGLDLSDNRISDLEPLKGMVKLKNLNLARNQITEIGPLVALIGLEGLDLSDNEISDAGILVSLRELTFLDLRNNPPSIACPLAKESYCLLGDFKTTNSFIGIALPGIPRRQHSATRLPSGEVLITGGWEKEAIHAQLYDLEGKFPHAFAMQENRSGHQASLLKDGRVLISGGWGKRSLEVFDRSSLSFGRISQQMKHARAGHQATVLGNGEVLITGGWESSIWTGSYKDAVGSAEIFGAPDNRLKVLPNMIFRRAEHTATWLEDGTVLIAGGFTSEGGLPTVELYFPELQSFGYIPKNRKGRMTVPRWAHTATRLPDGRVLIVGGFSGPQIEPHPTAELFDPKTGEFRKTRGGDLTVPRARHTATLLSDGRVLILGGISRWELDFDTCSACLDSAEVYDPASETFTRIPKKMSWPRLFHSATPLDDYRVLITGGASYSASRTGEIYEYRRK